MDAFGRHEDETSPRETNTRSNTSVESSNAIGILRSLRISQWAKNAILFVPLLAAHRWDDPSSVARAVLAFVTLSLVASGTYLINDLVDTDADRQHPTKRHRPLAAGTLSPAIARLAACVLILGGCGLSFAFASAAATQMLLGYLAITLAYSFYLKKRMVLDVIVLAGLYTHRILIGGVATEIAISPWLLAFSLFIFMSLALVKRYLELDAARHMERREIARRAYTTDDTETIFMMGLISGYLSVLVLCLFVSSDDVSTLYSTPIVLWAICPIMLYWVSRIWLLARRQELGDDPVAFAIGDASSYACAALLGITVAAAL